MTCRLRFVTYWNSINWRGVSERNYFGNYSFHIELYNVYLRWHKFVRSYIYTRWDPYIIHLHNLFSTCIYSVFHYFKVHQIPRAEPSKLSWSCRWSNNDLICALPRDFFIEDSSTPTFVSLIANFDRLDLLTCLACGQISVFLIEYQISIFLPLLVHAYRYM